MQNYATDIDYNLLSIFLVHLLKFIDLSCDGLIRCLRHDTGSWRRLLPRLFRDEHKRPSSLSDTKSVSTLFTRTIDFSIITARVYNIIYTGVGYPPCSASPLKNPYNNSSRQRGGRGRATMMLENERETKGENRTRRESESRAPLRQRGPFFMNIRTRANKFE